MAAPAADTDAVDHCARNGPDDRSVACDKGRTMFDNLKRDAALVALSEVRDGMTLGLGSGSTAEEFVKMLGAAVGLGELRGLRCTCTSTATESLARSMSVSTFPLHELFPLDLTVDGADEIDQLLRLIKGHGGALLREKIVEQNSRRFIVIADESKLVDRLGRGALPVEVTPFARETVQRTLDGRGLQPKLRMKENREFVTDEGHLIYDVTLSGERDIAEVVDDIRALAGVVETGFFPREATEAIVAGADGVKRWWRS
jgi:ribose 5-phosphate isomerase A